MSEAELRTALAETARQTVRHGLNKGASGNVSVRLDQGLLVTPSGLAN
jgi:L-fuculose-phosphate aldolase